MNVGLAALILPLAGIAAAIFLTAVLIRRRRP